MSLFSFANGQSLSNDMIDDIQTMVLVREPDRLNELPSNFSVISGSMLGYDSSKEGYVDSAGYYHAAGPGAGGQAIAILQDDGTIAISFRGTNDPLDLSAVTMFPNNSYIYGFDEWLKSVADFAEQNNYKIDLVTGKSLGGAAVNMLRDESKKIAGGAYDDAKYFAVASPLVADRNDNLINYGYKNDYAHEWYEERMAIGKHDESSVTDNLVYYNDEYASSRWFYFLEFSAHSYNSFSRGVDALQATKFADELEQDSFVILAETKTIKVGRAASRSDIKTDDNYVISVNDKSHVVYGNSKNDHIEMGDGKDRIYSGSGNDVIYGGGSGDYIKAGRGNDYVDGESGYDKIYGERGNDEIHAGGGSDTVYGGSGHDLIFGDNYHDQLHGGSGNDTLVGGSGNDLLWGDSGADTFVFDGLGNDTIKDFQVGVDHLKLDDDLADTYTNAEIAEMAKDTSGGDVQISLSNGGSTIIENVSISDLEQYAQSNDFNSWADAVFV